MKYRPEFYDSSISINKVWKEHYDCVALNRIPSGHYKMFLKN